MMDRDNQDKLNHMLSSMDQTEGEAGLDEGGSEEGETGDSDKKGKGKDKDKDASAKGKDGGRHSAKLKHSKTVVEKEKAAKDAKDEKEDKQKNPKEKAPKKV
jgi:hypothetical protein